MTQKKIFCEECRNDVDYMITEVPMTGCNTDLFHF